MRFAVIARVGSTPAILCWLSNISHHPNELLAGEFEQPEVFRLLSTVGIPGQYIGDGACLVARRPVIRLDERGRTLQVSFTADEPSLAGAT
jgi:hypothetical protein